MSNNKYECRRCGRPFQPKSEEKPVCIHCGSKDVALQPERVVPPSSCGAKGRFT